MLFCSAHAVVSQKVLKIEINDSSSNDKETELWICEEKKGGKSILFTSKSIFLYAISLARYPFIINWKKSGKKLHVIPFNVVNIKTNL